MAALTRTFSVLRIRDFRIYWVALLVSLLGTAFQQAAQDWLVYRLTGSAALLGVAAFVPAVLAAPFSLLGGALADRFPRRKLILFTQTAMMVPPLALALLIATNQVQVWHVVLASAVLAILVSVDAPARLALVNDLVGGDDLAGAMGMSTAVYQVARIVGPAMAGILISLNSEAIPFLINGLSYGPMVGALALMRVRTILPPRKRQGLGTSTVEGLRFVVRNNLLFGLIVLSLLQGALLMPYIRLMPVFAKDVLHQGADAYGLLLSASAVGAIVGALLVSYGGPRRGLLLLLGCLAGGAVLLGFAYSREWSMVILLLVGLGLLTSYVNTLNLTLLQVHAPDEMRGRVMGIVSILYLGSVQAGLLPLSLIAQRAGVSAALAVAAILVWVGTLIVGARFAALRRVA